MHVFLTIAGLDPEYGGPSRSVPALAEALARDGAKVELITCEPAASRPAPRLPDARLVSTRVLPFADRATRWAARHNGFFSALQERCRATPDSVIHDNGLWLPGNHAAAAAARELNPRLIAARR